MKKFLIGKGIDRSVMIYVELDLSRNTELTGNFMIPTKQSILRGIGNVYYSSLPSDGEGCVRLYRYDNYYVKWKGKMYHVDSPEKYDVLKEIFSTLFAIENLK